MVTCVTLWQHVLTLATEDIPWPYNSK